MDGWAGSGIIWCGGKNDQIILYKIIFNDNNKVSINQNMYVICGGEIKYCIWPAELIISFIDQYYRLGDIMCKQSL